MCIKSYARAALSDPHPPRHPWAAGVRPALFTPPPPPAGQAVSIIVNAYAKLAVPAPALLHHMADVALAINTGSAPHRAGPGRAGSYTTARRGGCGWLYAGQACAA